MQKLIASALSLAVLAAPAVCQEEQNDPESVEALLKELKEQRDNAEVDVVKKLANKKSREAMQGLIEVYDEMASIYMRRAICQGLALYDDVEGAEQPALQKLMDVATGAKERELRETSVELIAGADNYGKAFLTMIVESSADDDTRERAMEHHVNSARAEDMEWYRAIYDPTAEEKAKKASKKAKDEKDKVPHALQPLRVLAFEALKADMEAKDVLEAASDKNKKIRGLAMQELESREDSNALSVAEDIYKKANEPVSTKLVAARIMARDQGPKIADDFIKDATKKATPRELAFGLADILADMKDESVDAKLLKKAGKGKGQEKLFYLRASKHIDDPKLDKALIKMIKDKDPEVQRNAIEILGERRNKDALPELEKLIQKGKDPLVLAAVLGAMSSIRRNDVEWEKELVRYASHEDADIRNTAIVQIGRTKNADYLSVLTEALEHEQWATRLAAARGIEEMRVEEGVGPLCSRIPKETGRMQNEFYEILFRLTGKSFRSSPKMWEKWWADEGASFKIIKESELKKLEKEEETRRLKEITTTEFFGIRVQSHRVTFIIDVSGSMNDPTRGKYIGEAGVPRIDVAKSELVKCLDGLDLQSLFNIVTFSSDVDAWRERVAENTEATMEEAKGFVDRLGAGGATNLFGSLEFAFEDPDVDTIFVLSDGEPTAGSITDPMSIRETVRSWNENRGIVINCIAVGGQFQILEWLAEDTGGTHVKFP